MFSSASTGDLCDRNFSAPGSWTANDLLEPVSDLDIAAIESGGEFYDPTSVAGKPLVNMMFRPCHGIDDRAISGYPIPQFGIPTR